MKNSLWEFFWGRWLIEPQRRGRVVSVLTWRTAIAVYHPAGQLRRVKPIPRWAWWR